MIVSICTAVTAPVCGRAVGARVGHGRPTSAPAEASAAAPISWRVLGGDLLQRLRLGEGRGLRHHVAAAHRVAGVLVLHLGHQQLEEHVAAHLVVAVDVRGRRRRGDGAGRRSRDRSSEGSVQTRTSTPRTWIGRGQGPAGVAVGRPRPTARAVGSPAAGRGRPLLLGPPAAGPPAAGRLLLRRTRSRRCPGRRRAASSVRPADCRSRRRSGSAASSASRPCSCAPRS